MSSPRTRSASDSARGAQTRNVRLLIRYEPECCKRRQGDLCRERLAVPWDGLGFDRPHVAGVGAAVLLGVGVDQLAPAAGARKADAVWPAGHRCEVERCDEHTLVLLRSTREHNDVRVGVVRLDPVEAARVEVLLPERGLVLVSVV